MGQIDNVELVELAKNDAYLKEIGSKYTSSHYYDVSVRRDSEGWRIDLARKAFDETLNKNYRGKLFEDHVEEPRVFTAHVGTRRSWMD